jgi:hypothetical protein
VKIRAFDFEKAINTSGTDKIGGVLQELGYVKHRLSAAVL